METQIRRHTSLNRSSTIRTSPPTSLSMLQLEFSVTHFPRSVGVTWFAAILIIRATGTYARQDRRTCTLSIVRINWGASLGQHITNCKHGCACVPSFWANKWCSRANKWRSTITLHSRILPEPLLPRISHPGLTKLKPPHRGCRFGRNGREACDRFAHAFPAWIGCDVTSCEWWAACPNRAGVRRRSTTCQLALVIIGIHLAVLRYIDRIIGRQGVHWYSLVFMSQPQLTPEEHRFPGSVPFATAAGCPVRAPSWSPSGFPTDAVAKL
ncbi:hypothetical protein OBBRIDRAFT_791085 [Obba rivulosa]|uniref:Uncharacterized protein n=1 Tax=Obba rivulosa TaxID=1052685 RepID=A0A8E2DMU6_9APHY|nr:hypothetical protein OBBRIDRAFT_791085 [Obba rivulosa]